MEKNQKKHQKPPQSSTFLSYREYHLERLREALSKGEVDPPIVPLLKLINSSNHFVTTSSCSGRIVLLETDEEERKRESAFHRKWHRPVTFEEVWEGIASYSGNLVLWLKVDPLILHVATDSLERAKTLLSAVRSAGIKIAGIQVIDEQKIHIEIRGIDNLVVPVYWNGILVNENFVKTLVYFANKKLIRNQRRLERLYNALKPLFSKN